MEEEDDDWEIIDEEPENFSVVLLKPSSLGMNVLLGDNVEIEPCTKDLSKLTGANSQIQVISMPEFSSVEESQKFIHQLCLLKFINAFVLVVDGNSIWFENKIFQMLQVYKDVLGESFFKNLIMVVHWEMDSFSVKTRELIKRTKDTFQKDWAEELLARIGLKIWGFTIPFVFVEATNDFENFERQNNGIELGREKILGILTMNAIYSFNHKRDVNYEKEVDQQASKMNLKKCTKCQRYYARRKMNTPTQAIIAGVSVFSGVGILLQAGVCAYRIHTAEHELDGLQVMVGTGAAELGLLGGGLGGALIGSLFFPGIGTYAGATLGAIYGSVKLQKATERKLENELVHRCIPCRGYQVITNK